MTSSPPRVRFTSETDHTSRSGSESSCATQTAVEDPSSGKNGSALSGPSLTCSARTPTSPRVSSGHEGAYEPRGATAKKTWVRRGMQLKLNVGSHVRDRRPFSSALSPTETCLLRASTCAWYQSLKRARHS